MAFSLNMILGLDCICHSFEDFMEPSGCVCIHDLPIFFEKL
jgi:hypothetical protein